MKGFGGMLHMGVRENVEAERWRFQRSGVTERIHFDDTKCRLTELLVLKGLLEVKS